MEIMGLQLPGVSFIHPNTPLRDAMTAQTTRRAVQITHLGDSYTPAGQVIDEKAIVNGLVGLMATGGSTNLAVHMIAIARAAGIKIDWDDFADISAAVPLICRIYPNGSADVNHFHAAGGMAYLIGALINEGLVHTDVTTVAGSGGLMEYTKEPIRNGRADADYVQFRKGADESLDREILTDFKEPFRPDGGMRLLKGNLGRSVMKVSAVKRDHWLVEAPAVVVDHQDHLVALHQNGKLEKDFVAVVRFQGPKANGMPELHKFTPIMGSLQDKGFKVALVTDGRMSGASGKFTAAIHLVPEALDGGPISQVQNGDIIRVDPLNNSVEVLDDDLSNRPKAKMPKRNLSAITGMDMFAPMRAGSRSAEQGAGFLGEPDWMSGI